MESFFSANQDIRDFIKKNFDERSSEAIENVIRFLKEKEFSQLQTVFLLKEECNLPFQKANSLVLNSDSWNKLK